MLGEICLKKGDTVPSHARDNEQFTYVVEGALKFWFEDDGKEKMWWPPARFRHSAESTASG
jgi:quercetin dioxygenase-like cupin family protein